MPPTMGNEEWQLTGADIEQVLRWSNAHAADRCVTIWEAAIDPRRSRLSSSSHETVRLATAIPGLPSCRNDTGHRPASAHIADDARSAPLAIRRYGRLGLRAGRIASMHI
jgi:hypothetical protein